MSPTSFVKTEEGFRRHNVQENLKGVIYFHRTDNFDIEVKNLKFLKDNNIPCWPNLNLLIEMSDRHSVLKKCHEKGHVNHDILQITNDQKIDFPFPFVLKTGQEHRGEGKFLIQKESDIPNWEGMATIEPFFKGQSCRVLFIGDKFFVIKYDNPTSWIKNSAGADVEEWVDYPDELVEHAYFVKNLFKIDITGIDYIVSKNNKIHFLEINQFPGLDFSDETAQCAKKFLNSKMDFVEELANG